MITTKINSGMIVQVYIPSSNARTVSTSVRKSALASELL